MSAYEGLMGISAWDGIVTYHYLVFRPSAKVCARFVSYVLTSGLYQQEFSQRVRGLGESTQSSVRTPHIRIGDMLQTVMALPDLETQYIIADYLDAETARIDALIDKKKQLIDLLTLRWKRELLNTLAPHLEGDVLPAEWDMGRLRNFVDQVIGGSWGVNPGEGEVDAPCVRAADFDFANLIASGGATRSFKMSELTTRRVRTGELVLEKSGGGDESPVGRVVMWLGEEDAVPTNFAARLRPLKEHDPWFVLLAFRGAFEAGLNWRSIKQTTGIQNLDSGAYLAEPWPLPPLDDQRRIAANLRESLEASMSLKDRLRKQIDLLRERRGALITALVTGEDPIPGVAT
jgi:type I restriction enzyme S subunit